MLKAYKYRLLPTEEQKKTLSSWMGMCRFIYNLSLETKIAAWQSGRKNYSSFDLMKQMTELKRTECKWLYDCPNQCLVSSIINMDLAFKSLFRGRGFPKFKNRSSRKSLSFPQYTSVIGNQVRLTRIGLIDFIQHRPIGVGEIRTCVVSKSPTGHFFISILIKDKNELPEKKPDVIENSVGIDMGLKTFAVLSGGQKIENPKCLHQQLKRLRIEQRRLQRRFKKGAKEQSKGWKKQKLVVAKLHEKISNQRKDFLHKTSTAITKQFDTICLEYLNVSGMLQSRNLSKAISDVSWSEFNRMLEYKADWYGKNIRRIGRFEPSSKKCSDCGEINNDLTLVDRTWICASCGSEHDRDENAAKNIKILGFKTEPSTANVVQ